LYALDAEVFPSAKGYGKDDLADGGATAPGTMPWKGAQLGHSRDLGNSIWLNVFRNKMFRGLPPSMRTQLSLTSLTMGVTISRYRPGFGTKSGWSLGSKVMGTSYHLRYTGWRVSPP
jgi:hypothetical protein